MTDCPRCPGKVATHTLYNKNDEIELCADCFRREMEAKHGEIRTDNWIHWSAVFDGYEPGCPHGEGATEAEAIAELLDSAEADQSSNEPVRVELPPSIYRLPPGQCKFCDEHRDESMMPSHTPSHYCESGKRPHCTCDTCF